MNECYKKKDWVKGRRNEWVKEKRTCEWVKERENERKIKELKKKERTSE